MRSWKSFVLGTAATALTLAATNASAATIVNFNSDTPGPKANGFHSVDSSIVSFTDSIGSDLYVWTFAENHNNPCLMVGGDDGSKLLMDFSSPVSSLSLDFGNDDPNFGATTAWYGILKAFNGSTLVGETDLHVNANDYVDQTVTFTGATFNHAEFFFADGTKAPAMLTELVDNVTFTTAAVPEPTALALVLPAIAGVLRRRR